MKESSTYQAIIREGQVDALQKTVLRQGRQRFGAPSEEVEARIKAIGDVDQLERLTDRLLLASSWQELLAAR